jgi:nucleotide-binding universal stress UspA family protein
MESFGQKALAKLSLEAGDNHVQMESSIRGEGLLEALLAEARESDLLVIGLPPEPGEGTEPLLQAVRNAELPLLHKAECLVLVVCRPPRPIKRIVVDYEGGTAGKAALRAAGEVALRAAATVTVLCIDGDIRNAGCLASSAERYLEGYGLSSVAAVSQVGQKGSASEISHAAKSAEADLVVIGGEHHGLLNWLRDRTGPDPEVVATFTQIPVLVAR